MNASDAGAHSEKRQTPRLYRRFILRVAAFGEEPLEWSHVTIHNLSSTGALFTFDRPAHEGMLVYLKIDFPGRVIECLGRVVRLSGLRAGKFYDVAVHMEGITSVDRKYIDDFISQNLPVSY